MPGNPGYPGIVVSGSGNTYQVQLSPMSVPVGPTVSVKVLQIDSSQTIPAGTYLLVIQVGSFYYAQPAIWGVAPS